MLRSGSNRVTNMKTIAMGVGLFLGAAGTASADSKPAQKPPAAEKSDTFKPAAEMKAIKPFMASMTIKGTILPGGFGPGSKEMPTEGTYKCSAVVEGFGYRCELEEKIGTGQTMMVWKAQMVIGWEPASKLYKAVMVDNMGSTLPLDGKLDGQKLIWETPSPVAMGGGTVRNRLTLDMAAKKFLDEQLWTGTKDFKLFETATLTVGR